MAYARSPPPQVAQDALAGLSQSNDEALAALEAGALENMAAMEDNVRVLDERLGLTAAAAAAAASS